MDFKTLIVDWYNEKIVKGWYKTWVVWCSALAVIVPELIQVLVDNWELAFQAIPFFDDTAKATIRLAALVAIPVVRAVKQSNLPAPVEPKETA